MLLEQALDVVLVLGMVGEIGGLVRIGAEVIEGGVAGGGEALGVGGIVEAVELPLAVADHDLGVIIAPALVAEGDLALDAAGRGFFAGLEGGGKGGGISGVGRKASEIEERWDQAEDLDESVDAFAAGNVVGGVKEVRHGGHLVIEGLLLEEALVAEVRAVIGNEGNDGVGEQGALAHPIEEAAAHGVGKGATGIVIGAGMVELLGGEEVTALNLAEDAAFAFGLGGELSRRGSGDLEAFGLDLTEILFGGDYGSVRRVEGEAEEKWLGRVAGGKPLLGVADVEGFGGEVLGDGEFAGEDPTALEVVGGVAGVIEGVEVAGVVLWGVGFRLDDALGGATGFEIEWGAGGSAEDVLFAEGGSLVAGVAEAPREVGGLLGEAGLVVEDLVGEGEFAGEEGGAAGNADGGWDVGVAEKDAVAGEGVQMGELRGGAAVGGEGIGTLLVGHEPEDVGAA
jgi:hypothetical protein